MTNSLRRVGVATILMALVVVIPACGSSNKTAPATTTTTSPATGTSAAVSTSTATTPSTPAYGSSAATTTQGPQTGWTGPSLQPDGAVPIAAFNALLDTSHEAWTRSPLRTAVEFLQLDETKVSTTTARVSTNPESLTQADVVVTLDGLLDDSVRATRFDLHLTRQSDESWRLDSARWSQQCQPNRGHQDFTPALCV